MKIIDRFGTIKYYDSDKLLHRDEGPALEYKNGEKYWLQHGKFHRLDGPAFEFQDDKSWYFNGKAIPVKSQEQFERYIKLMVFI